MVYVNIPVWFSVRIFWFSVENVSDGRHYSFSRSIIFLQKTGIFYEAFYFMEKNHIFPLKIILLLFGDNLCLCCTADNHEINLFFRSQEVVTQQ